jgi:hypothetical protein
MSALHEGDGAAEDEMRAREDIAEFEGPHRRSAEKVAREHLETGREDQRNDEQRRREADASRDAFYGSDDNFHDGVSALIAERHIEASGTVGQ